MPAPSPRSSASESALHPKLPLRLGRFTLCEELGSGGMATVYLARMELAAKLERLVALKTIHPHLAKERAFVDMFLDEARIASLVGHPNVCSTYDFGEVDGVYYLAMEFLLGEPLFDVINRMVERFEDAKEVLPFLAARIVADAAEGIHAAHAARGPDGDELHIVHRDVSPQNLFLTYDGAVKVVDFGCAKAAERVAHTSTGVLKGKVGYAAPEQLKADHVDHRADVWALGVCLWETLTLSPLFSRDTAVKTAMAVLEQPIERASEGRDWVPEAVADIAARALTRDRSRRYATAREMSRDLRRFIADAGYTLESAELAEWMDFLFDDRHAEREAQARRVRELDTTNVSTAPLYDVTAADVELLESQPAMEAIYEDDAEASSPPSRAVSGPVKKGAASTPPAARRRRRWPYVLAALVLLAVGGLYAYQTYELAPWVYELIGTAPPPAREAPSEPTGEAIEGDEGDEGEDVLADDPFEAAASSEPTPEATEATEATEPSAPSDATEPPAAGAPAEEPEAAPAGRRGRRGDGPGVITTVVSGGGSGGDWSAPSPAPTPTPAPAPGAARISIAASSGYADIFLGGRRLGRTPLTTELPEGTHHLRVLPYGQEPAESMTVRVRAGIDEDLVLDVVDPASR